MRVEIQDSDSMALPTFLDGVLQLQCPGTMSKACITFPKQFPNLILCFLLMVLTVYWKVFQHHWFCFKGKGGKHDKIHRDVCIYSMGIFYSGVAGELKPTDYSIAQPVSSTQDGCGFFWKTVPRIHAWSWLKIKPARR